VFFPNKGRIFLSLPTGQKGTPSYMSNRIIFLTTHLTAVTILTSYSAYLICSIMTRVFELPFNSFEQLLKAGTYRLAPEPYSSQIMFFKVILFCSFVLLLLLFFLLLHLSNNRRSGLNFVNSKVSSDYLFLRPLVPLFLDDIYTNVILCCSIHPTGEIRVAVVLAEIRTDHIKNTNQS
jgi:hypothetical protein